MAATVARRIPLAGVLMLGMASLAWADKVAEVGADFLEYLGSLEDTDDNWTDFTAEAIATRQATAPSGALAANGAAKSSAPSRPVTSALTPTSTPAPATASHLAPAAASSKSSSHEMSKAEQ